MCITDGRTAPSLLIGPRSVAIAASSELRLRRGRFRFAFLLAAAIAVLPLAVTAAEGGGAEPLAPWQVEAVIATYPLVRGEARDMVGGDPLAVRVSDDKKAAPGLTLPAAVATLEGTDAYPVMSESLAEYGFTSPQAWALLTERVLEAYRTDRAMIAYEDLVARLDALGKRIRFNPQLTAEEKARAFDHLDTVPALMAPKPDNLADRAVVVPYRPALEQLFAPAS